MIELDRIVLVKRINNDTEVDACEDCPFLTACCESVGIRDVLGECLNSEYWEIESREQKEI